MRFSKNATEPPKEMLGSKQDHIKVSNGDVLEWATWEEAAGATLLSETLRP